MTDLTRALLDAAADLLAARGSHGLRMADVATRAGVSRQTVYNEFGNKDNLVHAVVLDKTAWFLDGVQTRLAAAPDPFEGLRDAISFVFEQTAVDPLSHSVFSGAHAEDLLPLVTTKGHAILWSAVEVFRVFFQAHWPQVSAERLALVTETAVRMAISHLLTPGGDPVAAVVTVARSLLPPPASIADAPAR